MLLGVLGVLRVSVGTSWGDLGCSWTFLGCSWGALWLLLGSLGCSWVFLGPLGALLVVSRVLWDCSWEFLGSSWELLSKIYMKKKVLLGVLGCQNVKIVKKPFVLCVKAKIMLLWLTN